MFTTFLLISLRIICYVIPVVFLISLFKPEKFNIRTKKNEKGKYINVRLGGNYDYSKGMQGMLQEPTSYYKRSQSLFK